MDTGEQVQENQFRSLSLIDEDLQAIQKVGNYGIVGKKSKTTGKRILLFMILLLALTGIGFAVWLSLQGHYTDAIEEQIQLLNHRDTNLEHCLDASVGEMKKQFIKEYGDFLFEAEGKYTTWNDDISNLFVAQYENLENSFGEDFKVTYDIKEETRLNKKELEHYYDDMEDYLSNKIREIEAEETELTSAEKNQLIGFLKDWKKQYAETEVTKGYSAIVTFTYESQGQSRDVTTRMIIVEMNNEWIIKVGGLITLDSAEIIEHMKH